MHDCAPRRALPTRTGAAAVAGAALHPAALQRKPLCLRALRAGVQRPWRDGQFPAPGLHADGERSV